MESEKTNNLLAEIEKEKKNLIALSETYRSASDNKSNSFYFEYLDPVI